MTLREIKDVPYYSPDSSAVIDPLRTLDLYFSLGDSSAAPSESVDAILIVFLHGGAWRAGDKKVHMDLARRWASLPSSSSSSLLSNARSQSVSSPAPRPSTVVVAVPNYRLSPTVKHPVHTRDVHQALQFLLRSSDSGSGSSQDIHTRLTLPSFRYSEVWIAGHSAGAHIAASLVLSPPSSVPHSHLDLAEGDTNDVLRRITGIIGIEGIYDIDALMDSFPSPFYRGFVEQAFGTRSPLAPATPSVPSRSVDSNTPAREPRPYDDVNATLYTLPGAGTADHLRWAVVHSRGDTLVDLIQAERMASRLRELYNGVETEEFRNGEEKEERVVLELDRVTGEHDDLLDSEALALLVGDFILG